MSEYPPRDPFFAHRVTRLLAKVCAAQEIGADGCWLVTVVAHQEDTCRYTKAVTFWNEQLMPLCGFGSRKRLVVARQAAIDCGWLHYECGTKSTAGKYWTLIPAHLDAIPDTPIDNSCRSESERQTERNVNGKRNGMCTSFIPIPIPEECATIDGQQNVKTARFVAPTIDDVRAYCRERGNQIDPAAFLDFYQSKGWRVGSQPMKDWRAAVRTWERREARDGKPADSIYKELRLPT